MKNILFLSAFLLSVSVAGQDINYAKEIVQKLSSPEMKGRGYVENGNREAAEFIRQQFSDIGLKPFYKNYFQPFNIRVNTFPARMEFAVDGKILVPGKEFIIDPSSPPIHGKFTIYSIYKKDLLDIEMIPDIIKSSTGKVLMINESGFESDAASMKKADELVQFFKFDLRAKNVATVILTNDKLTWSTSSRQSVRPTFVVKRNSVMDSAALVNLNVDAVLKDHTTNNIVGYVEGSEKPDSFLVLLAHYDHLGKMGRDVYFPGANDNASGIAMMLSLAKHFKENPPASSVVFIALSGEEIGIEGASFFVDHPFFDLARITFLINFDLAGTGDEGIKVVNGSLYKEKFNLLSKLNEQHGYLKSVQIRGAACNSDHCMFHNAGVPCFYIYTLGGTQAYHDIDDRYETLPLTEFSDYCRLMIDFITHITL